jgi:hypothetical protein
MRKKISRQCLFPHSPLPLNGGNLNMRRRHLGLHEELAPDGAHTGELEGRRVEVDEGKSGGEVKSG